MKAIIWTRYGPPDVLELRDVPKPAPKANEVLIRVRAASVTAGDCEMRNLSGALWYSLALRGYLGLAAPRRRTILGMEIAGDVESAGTNVTRFKAGDPVFAMTGLRFGAYAEYTCLPEQSASAAVALKPTNMTYEEAAAVPMAAQEALHFLRKAEIKPGERVLINGAGGSIGSFAVQLARHFGAHVTAVDSAGKLDLLRSLGADSVLDYTKEDFTRSGETYDVVLDIAGRSHFARSLRSLRSNGRYVLANPRLWQMVRGRLPSITRRQRVVFGPVSPDADNLLFLKGLIEAGSLKSVVDRCYPMEQIVEAHRYVETGQKRGHVVITIGHEPSHHANSQRSTNR